MVQVQKGCVGGRIWMVENIGSLDDDFCGFYLLNFRCWPFFRFTLLGWYHSVFILCLFGSLGRVREIWLGRCFTNPTSSTTRFDFAGLPPKTKVFAWFLSKFHLFSGVTRHGTCNIMPTILYELFESKTCMSKKRQALFERILAEEVPGGFEYLCWQTHLRSLSGYCTTTDMRHNEPLSHEKIEFHGSRRWWWGNSFINKTPRVPTKFYAEVIASTFLVDCDSQSLKG